MTTLAMDLLTQANKLLTKSCPECKGSAVTTTSTDDGRTFLQCECGHKWQPTTVFGESKEGPHHKTLLAFGYERRSQSDPDTLYSSHAYYTRAGHGVHVWGTGDWSAHDDKGAITKGSSNTKLISHLYAKHGAQGEPRTRYVVSPEKPHWI